MVIKVGVNLEQKDDQGHPKKKGEAQSEWAIFLHNKYKNSGQYKGICAWLLIPLN